MMKTLFGDMKYVMYGEILCIWAIVLRGAAARERIQIFIGASGQELCTERPAPPEEPKHSANRHPAVQKNKQTNQ